MLVLAMTDVGPMPVLMLILVLVVLLLLLRVVRGEGLVRLHEGVRVRRLGLVEEGLRRHGLSERREGRLAWIQGVHLCHASRTLSPAKHAHPVRCVGAEKPDKDLHLPALPLWEGCLITSIRHRL